MKYFFVSLIVLGFSLLSCNDETESSSFRSIDTVTGLNLFDENGAAIGRLGLPNDKQGDALVFPIPAIGAMSILVQSGTIDKIYTIPSTCDDDDVPADVVTQLETETYSVAALETAAGTNTANVYTIPGESQSVSIDISGKTAGFYRIFVLKADGELLWYNTYIDPTVTSYPDFSFYDMQCL